MIGLLGSSFRSQHRLRRQRCGIDRRIDCKTSSTVILRRKAGEILLGLGTLLLTLGLLGGTSVGPSRA
jgi:hypothetical protein